jgi:predicted secreted protein
MKTVNFSYLTTIKNFTPQEANVALIDQVPVSQSNEIKVEQVSFEPKWTEEKKDKPGVYHWKLLVPTGGKQEVKSSYRVSYPVDFQVDGL